jgi:hypothetical protein
MKAMLYIAALVVGLSSLSNAGGGMTETSLALKQMAMAISDTEQSPPNSLEDVALLREVAESSPWIIKKINTVALVPGAPVIQPAPGISSKYQGKRFFAVGRTTNSDYARGSEDSPKEPGRYFIFFEKDGMSGDAHWIPESQIQAMLKQVKGFDPTKQPLVFQDVEAEADARKKRVLDSFKLPGEIHPPKEVRNGANNENPGSTRTPVSGESDHENGADRSNNLPWWLAAIASVLLLATCGAWFKIRTRTSKHH